MAQPVTTGTALFSGALKRKQARRGPAAPDLAHDLLAVLEGTPSA